MNQQANTAEVTEGREELMQLNVRIEAPVRRRVAMLAAARDQNLGSFVNELFKKFLFTPEIDAEMRSRISVAPPIEPAA